MRLRAPRARRTRRRWSTGPALARLRGTLVILMGLKNLPAIAATLQRARSRAGHPRSRSSRRARPGTSGSCARTLATVAAEVQEAALRPPAVVVVGAVVDALTT